jgi:hypothetical protein
MAARKARTQRSLRRRKKAPVARAAAQPAEHAVDTLGEWLSYIGVDLHDPDWTPFWPPDAFAVAAALLRRTGGYVELVNGLRSRSRLHVLSPPDLRDLGRAWRDILEKRLHQDKSTDACPVEVKNWWGELRRCAGKSIAECAQDAELIAAVCNLCSVSDAASAGIGIRPILRKAEKKDQTEGSFLAFAQKLLTLNERRSYCLRIPVDKLAVLGKQHTPQRGCTIRSLTHHLSLYIAAEIEAYWAGPYPAGEASLDVFNLLLLPWPARVRSEDFRVVPTRSGRPNPDAAGRPHRYFDFAPLGSERPDALAARVARALETASLHADRIHGIVFPELALTPAQYLAIERVAIEKEAVLVAGIRLPESGDTDGMPGNACAVQPMGLTAAPATWSIETSTLAESMRCVQLKHHRWCLDRNQILQYELGGRLPASRDCWERIFIGNRAVTFVTLASWLTICVLICEDLARQDPVTDVIRAVGPNLVFALLMDGPQLRNRWPSRYASVLAEDPGSSVLTITSLGMSSRSRPKEGDADRSRTIGLWRDAVYGEQELTLAPDHDACVLSLVCKSQREYTIDGRDDGETAHFPVFAGTHSFSTDAARSRSRR